MKSLVIRNKERKQMREGAVIFFNAIMKSALLFEI